ncbi:hypothetical protein Jiend_59230 [Micromonospora endophytica]|nr:AraC family transcriptional regulator [Micromonospora endophytica]BCJ62501.1 hypothetical protein Jiend_59230 [Micromonospora endophytica]
MVSQQVNRHRVTGERTSAIVRAISRMRDQLHEPLTLIDIAQTEHFSPFHFHRVFREITTVTPARFLAALRMAEARRLLVHSQLTVAEVSTEVGYRSTGTFTTQFTRLVGIPPERFRRVARALPDRPVASLLLAARSVLRPQQWARVLVRPENCDPQTLLFVHCRPVRGDRTQHHNWTSGTGQVLLPIDTLPFPGEYQAQVIAIAPSATPTEALVNHAAGSYLVGTARFRSPLHGPSNRQVTVPLRQPLSIDPPPLSVAPVRLLADLANRFAPAKITPNTAHAHF